MKKYMFTAAVGAASIFYAQEKCADIRINQIQVLGTHNSYAKPVDPKVLDLTVPIIKSLMEKYNSGMSSEQKAKFQEYHPNGMDFHEALKYDHPDFVQQLNANLRGLELDVYYDPDGNRFNHPASYRILKEKGVKDLAPHDTKGLDKPGFKVLHMADIDFRSHYPTLKDALTELRKWSDQHPQHTTLFIMIEAKDSGFPIFPNSTQVLPFTSKAYDDLDQEISQYLGRNKIITPKEVQGKYATLREAVMHNNWPKVEDSKGKFVLMLLPGSAGTLSTKNNPYLIDGSLEKRLMFMDSEPEDSFAAFILMDNAIVRQQEIQTLVKQGFMVRTRADIETYEAKINDLTRSKAAFSSGAQVVSTDFFRSGNTYGTSYFVKPPQDKDYLINPVNTNCH
ncbi:calcium-dependent phosphoinositide phospholipase C [Chryseobacterium sp. 52]|uniref:phosphatidylinositol-specific phospholipase C domain-containing protein n=1 Tax=Chryseobacterium sp. 52 TaxID=2035213 RepID=UPI000C1A3824|nr:phosphatidylinositol-specific phospholipase C domain-containing protein [Chryseobacterium sp. 52]PIF45425.1 calcium-dependent phosphoinositide phospholipase C [Chryseobacterium sp. 52]